MASEYHKDLSHLTWEHVWERQALRGELAQAYWRASGAGPAARVLDVGSGPGFFALRYAAFAPRGRVLATDASEEALAFLRERARGAGNLGTRVWDAEAGPLAAGVFDVAFATDMLHHVEDPEAVLRHVRESAPRLVVAEFSPEGRGEFGPPLSERLGVDRLRHALATTGWRVVAVESMPFEHDLVVADRA